MAEQSSQTIKVPMICRDFIDIINHETEPLVRSKLSQRIEQCIERHCPFGSDCKRMLLRKEDIKF